MACERFIVGCSRPPWALHHMLESTLRRMSFSGESSLLQGRAVSGGSCHVGLSQVRYFIPHVLVSVLIVIFLAGSISQTLTYPFDVLRRKMQVTGMKDTSVKYNNALHALTSIVRTEGASGLYRGLWPNLRKFLFSNL